MASLKKRIGVNGTIIFLAALCIALRPGWFLRTRVNKLEIALGFWGMALVMFGLLLRVSSRGYKSENSGNGHVLVKGGPYQLVRNPMYLGIFLIGTGAIMVSFSWWVMGVFFMFLAARYYTLIVKEEKLLLEHFGEEYREYRSKTPRLFFRAGIWRAPALAEFLPLRRKWLQREINSVIIVPVLIVALEIAKTVFLARAPLVTGELVGFGLVICVFILFAVRLEREYERVAG